MVDDSTIDPSTGLLDRAAFLKEVRDGQSKVPSHVRRGSLLILHFPMLQSIAEKGGSDAATVALRNLLAVVETRLRSRDTLGRIADHSLCVLLRQCREKDAVIIAEQYVALLHDVIIDTGVQTAPMELRYRIVPLDSLGRRPRQGVSRVVKETTLAGDISLAHDVQIPGQVMASAPGKVVSIHASKDIQSNPNSKQKGELAAKSESDAKARSHNVVVPLSTHKSTNKVANWRLKPGLLLNDKLLICCYRLQLVGVEADDSPLQSNQLFQCVLNALALDAFATRPAVESQLILPVQASQLSKELPAWIKKQCTGKRVAPSDVCLSLTVESISKDLRSTVPILRLLNRQGIRLMLEGVTSTGQFRALQNLAGFDYLYISARQLQASSSQIRQRQELEALIAEAKAQHREICTAGVDTKVLLAHAKQLGIDIGFGRLCGKSLPFPDTLKQ